MLRKILKNYINSYKFFVPFETLIEDGIVLNKNNGFQSTFKIRFFDLDYLGKDDIRIIQERFNNAYKRLPDGYTIHFEVQRNKSDKYPTKDLRDKAYPTQIIDKIRENSVKKETFYITEYYITITYIMDNETKNNIEKLFSSTGNIKISSKDTEKNYEELLKEFRNELKEFKSTIDLFSEQMKTGSISIELLKKEELLGFLYATINMEKKEKVRVPNNNIMLDEYLTVSNIANSNVTKFNDEYVKVVTINMFPDEVSTRVFNDLENLNFEYRYITRFIILNKDEALTILKNFRVYYNAKMKSFFQWFIEAATQKEVTNVDTTAIDKINEVDIATNELKTGNLAYGYYTFSFIIKDKNLEELDKKVQEVKKILNFYDFTAGEDKYNTLDTLFGAIPGNVVNNVRKAPMNTYLLAGIMPMSSIYTGDKYNKHLKDIALFTTKTTKELFYFNLHNRDIGHTLIVGPTGAGKSFLLGMIAANFLKYDYKKIENNNEILKNAQVFFFDKDASSRVLTYSSGGKFYDLGNNEVAFQPLKNIDIMSEREWALGWVLGILEQEGINPDARVRTLVWEALNSLCAVKQESRTLSNLIAYVQSTVIKEALYIYCGNEAYGQYFDNNIDNISNNNFITFEMGDVMNKPKVIAPLLDYIFHKIENEKLDGTPTLIILDECWLFLKNEKMRDKIEEWLRVLRKKNTSVIFATQSLTEIYTSPIFAPIIDACKTQIFLPNEKAISTWLELYKKFNLTEKEIEEINDAIMKQDYFVKSPDGSRLFQINPSSIEIAYLGSSTKNDQNKIIAIKQEIDKMYLSDEEKLKELNKKWLLYKHKIGLISEKEIKEIRNILK